MHRRLTLSPLQLTIFMSVLILGPIGCGLLLSYFTRRFPEPKLEAMVRLDTTWLRPKNGAEPRLVPCLAIKNPTDQDWNNLSVGINEQFYSSEAKQVGAGEIVMLPLENFVSRNGSVRFPVGNRDIKLVTVFSQIETGARAVSEHVMPTQPKVKPPGDLSDEDWIRDVRP